MLLSVSNSSKMTAQEIQLFKSKDIQINGRNVSSVISTVKDDRNSPKSSAGKRHDESSLMKSRSSIRENKNNVDVRPQKFIQE